MNRRGAAPGAAKEKRGKQKRFNRAKSQLEQGDRDTQRLMGEADSALCLSGGLWGDRSLCDCLRWTTAAKGTNRHGRTGLNR